MQVLKTLESDAAALGLAAPSSSTQSIILAHVMDQEHNFHKVSEQFTERLYGLSGCSLTVSHHIGGDLSD
ncbi:hypothetical protein [Ruegeria lacuscaerulensis]|uniref:hypothetical protein n=1 Tax=Ruegeria lacuscaerulensis TaxID=55218 RepID=UPI00147A7342|nr:hypothetical protein [Ruegeria lacuscaerulensis]